VSHEGTPFGKVKLAPGDDGIERPPPAPESDSWAESDPATKWEWEKAFRARFANEDNGRAAFAVATVLAMHADGDGTNTFPSVDRLVQETGYSRSATLGALKTLRLSGWVQQVSQGSGASKKTSVYRLSIPRVQPSGPHQTI